MPDVSDALIERIVRTIVDEVRPEQVILFGSRGRGDFRADSDVDLLVIESVDILRVSRNPDDIPDEMFARQGHQVLGLRAPVRQQNVVDARV